MHELELDVTMCTCHAKSSNSCLLSIVSSRLTHQAIIALLNVLLLPGDNPFQWLSRRFHHNTRVRNQIRLINEPMVWQLVPEPLSFLSSPWHMAVSCWLARNRPLRLWLTIETRQRFRRFAFFLWNLAQLMHTNWIERNLTSIDGECLVL